MHVAVIGSRGLTVTNLSAYLPPGTTQIVSGGAVGIDACARQYALRNGIALAEFLPEYERYGSNAPLRRNIAVVLNSDLVLAFWDGRSPGTESVIHQCRRLGVPYRVYVFDRETKKYALLLNPRV